MSDVKHLMNLVFQEEGLLNALSAELSVASSGNSQEDAQTDSKDSNPTSHRTLGREAGPRAHRPPRENTPSIQRQARLLQKLYPQKRKPSHSSSLDFQMALTNLLRVLPAAPLEVLEMCHRTPICTTESNTISHLARILPSHLSTVIYFDQVEWGMGEAMVMGHGIVFGPPISFNGPCPWPSFSPELSSVRDKIQHLFLNNGTHVFYLGMYVGYGTKAWFPTGVRYPGDPISLERLTSMAMARKNRPVTRHLRPVGWEGVIQDKIIAGIEGIDCVMIGRIHFDRELFHSLLQRYENRQRRK